MRQISKIVIHCSATTPTMDIGFTEINQWHKDRGWSGCGYHYIIRRNGKIELGRYIGKIGAHAKGHNKDSIGICYVGGVDSNNNAQDNRTMAQKLTLTKLLKAHLLIFGKLDILGHRDLAGVKKECPCFDVKEYDYLTKEL